MTRVPELSAESIAAIAQAVARQLPAATMPAGALSRRDACAYLGGVSERYLDQLAAAGEIQRIKLGAKSVYLRHDLDKYLESRREPPKKTK